MLRFLKRNQQFDVSGKIKGRGFYICPECLNKKVKMYNKEQIKEQIKKHILNLLQLGWKGRLIKIGYDDVIKELKKGTNGFLILAKDVSKRTKRNILYKYKGEYFEIFTKEKLGHFLGKKEVGIIFIPETKFGLKIKEFLNKYKQLK